VRIQSRGCRTRDSRGAPPRRGPARAARRGRATRASSRGSRRRPCGAVSSRGGDARSGVPARSRHEAGGGAARETRRRKRSWADGGGGSVRDRPYTILPPPQMRAGRGKRRRSGSLHFPVMTSRFRRSIMTGSFLRQFSKNRTHEEPGITELPVRESRVFSGRATPHKTSVLRASATPGKRHRSASDALAAHQGRPQR
jgi:hypothetical protein